MSDDYGMPAWGFLDLGHTAALAETKYGNPLPPGMQSLYVAVNAPCACACGTSVLAHDTLCPPWKHLTGDHPSSLEPAKIQTWWIQTLPHVTQMAHEIADAYGVPVDMVLSPNLGADADYTFQPHPDYGGYEIVGPPPFTEFAKGAGPTIGIVGHPVMTKKKTPMIPLGHAQPVVQTGWSNPASNPLADVQAAAAAMKQQGKKPQVTWTDPYGVVHAEPKDPELPEWVQKAAIASKVKNAPEPSGSPGLDAFHPPDSIKAHWDGKHWQVLENPTGVLIDGSMLDNLCSMAEPGIYWFQAEAVSGLIKGPGSCICVTAGPDIDGPDIDCPVHGYEAWDAEQYQAATNQTSITIETGMISPEALAIAFGVPPEALGIEPEPEPSLFTEIGPEPDWCRWHKTYVTASHPGDLVACISGGWVVPASQKDEVTAP